MEINLGSAEEMAQAANTLLQFAGERKIILFDGPLGAGKTTFIKEICRLLGSRDNFSSPTYSIVNEYIYEGGKIYHFDLFRVKNRNELLDLGIFEYLDSGNYCFIEWPELGEELITEPHIKVNIFFKAGLRTIKVSIGGG